MKLYAVRDRLLEIFQQPFVAHSDSQVMSSLAKVVNSQEEGNVITATPGDFELWSLADIEEETGRVKADPKFLANCARFVRGSVRGASTGAIAGDPAMDQVKASIQRPTGAPAGNGGTETGHPAIEAQSQAPGRGTQSGADRGGPRPPGSPTGQH